MTDKKFQELQDQLGIVSYFLPGEDQHRWLADGAGDLFRIGEEVRKAMRDDPIVVVERQHLDSGDIIVLSRKPLSNSAWDKFVKAREAWLRKS